MKAVVLCAGKGTRIREITGGEIPKPMIEVEDKPILERTLEWLKNYDVDEVLVNLHHQGEEIQDYFGSSYKGLDITYYWEEELLGTAGALKQMEDDLEEEFFVIYGDIVTDLDLDNLHGVQASSNASGTVMVYSGEEDLSEASIISLDSKNRIEAFIEKPDRETISEFQGEVWTNAGVYCLYPEILNYIEEEKDFSHDIFPEVLKGSGSLKGFKLPEEAYWTEIGNPEKYRQLKKDVENSLIEW